MTYTRIVLTLFVFAIGGYSDAAPVGSFSGTFPEYTFTAFCENPPGETIIFGMTDCEEVNIAYVATGSTSLFANAELSLETLLDPALPGPFPFSGTFLLTNLDDPSQSILGTLAGAGMIAGPPGPPVGFPPFAIQALLITTGGTGSFTGASGASRLNGSALFTFLNEDATFASGEGAIGVEAVPEPGSGVLLLAASAAFGAVRKLRRAAAPLA